MIYNYFNFKYAIWNVENDKFQELKNNQEFNNHLIKSFSISAKQFKHGIKPNQTNGYAYSIPIDAQYFYLFEYVFNPCLSDKFKQIGIDFNHVKYKRCWANRMHYGSSGKIHSHVDKNGVKVYTLILYYNIPKQNSGDLIFLNPEKYQSKCLDFPIERIDEKDKFHIKVSEGMCILHEGEIPHAVSKHENDDPRDAIIIEFIAIDRSQL